MRADTLGKHFHTSDWPTVGMLVIIKGRVRAGPKWKEIYCACSVMYSRNTLLWYLRAITLNVSTKAFVTVFNVVNITCFGSGSGFWT